MKTVGIRFTSGMAYRPLHQSRYYSGTGVSQKFVQFAGALAYVETGASVNSACAATGMNSFRVTVEPATRYCAEQMAYHRRNLAGR